MSIKISQILLMMGVLVTWSCSPQERNVKLKDAEVIKGDASHGGELGCEYPYMRAEKKGKLIAGLGYSLAQVAEYSEIENTDLNKIFNSSLSVFSIVEGPFLASMVLEGDDLLEAQVLAASFKHTANDSFREELQLGLDERYVSSINFRLLPFYKDVKCLEKDINHYQTTIVSKGFSPVELFGDVPFEEIDSQLVRKNNTQRDVGKSFSAWQKDNIGVHFSVIKIFAPENIEKPDLYHLSIRLLDIPTDNYWQTMLPKSKK